MIAQCLLHSVERSRWRNIQNGKHSPCDTLDFVRFILRDRQQMDCAMRCASSIPFSQRALSSGNPTEPRALPDSFHFGRNSFCRYRDTSCFRNDQFQGMNKGTDKNGAKISTFESFFCGSVQLRPPFSMPIRKLEGEAEASRCAYLSAIRDRQSF